MSETIRKLRTRIGNFLKNPEMFAQQEAELSQRAQALRIKEYNIRTKEAGIFKSDLWANLVVGDYNPDKIGIDVYKKMVEYDAQVRSGLEILEMGVMVPWEIQHENEDVKEFLTWTLERLRRPTFEESIREIMTAVWAGYSVSETVWEYVRDQKKYSLRRELGLKTFDPETVKFYSTPKGHLKRITQTVGGQIVELDLRRCLVYSYQKKFGNWYGESILRACYKNWFIKDNMLKFANIAFERFGAPIMLGVARDIKSIDEVEDVLTHLYARSVGVIAKRGEKDPTDIKILESKRATMPFMDYINYHNRLILQRMLIGEPILKGGGGVYGPRITYEILQSRLSEIRRGVSGTLSTLLDLLTELNFDVRKPAKLVFAPVPQEEVLGKLEKRA